MGAGIPLPALDVKPPVIPQNPLAEFAQVSALKSQMQNQQLQQQEMQLRQQQIKDQQATTSAMQNWDPKSQTYDDLAKSVLQNGGSANAATAIQQHGLTVQQAMQNLSKDQLSNYVTRQKTIGDSLEGLIDPSVVPDDQLHGKALDTVMGLVNNGVLDKEHGMQFIQGIQGESDPTALRAKIDQFGKAAEGAKQIAELQKAQAETQQFQGRGRAANAEGVLKELEAQGLEGLNAQCISDAVDKVLPPMNRETGAQNNAVKQSALMAFNRGDLQGAKQALQEGLKSALKDEGKPEEGSYFPVPDGKGGTAGWINPKTRHFLSPNDIPGLSAATGGSGTIPAKNANSAADAEQIASKILNQSGGDPDKALRTFDQLSGNITDDYQRQLGPQIRRAIRARRQINKPQTPLDKILSGDVEGGLNDMPQPQ